MKSEKQLEGNEMLKQEFEAEKEGYYQMSSEVLQYAGKPEKKILAILEEDEVTARELSIKTKIAESSLYKYLRQLEKRGIVKHRYLRGDHSLRYVKHYRFTGRI